MSETIFISEMRTGSILTEHLSARQGEEPYYNVKIMIATMDEEDISLLIPSEHYCKLIGLLQHAYDLLPEAEKKESWESAFESFPVVKSGK